MGCRFIVNVFYITLQKKNVSLSGIREWHDGCLMIYLVLDRSSEVQNQCGKRGEKPETITPKGGDEGCNFRVYQFISNGQCKRIIC